MIFNWHCHFHCKAMSRPPPSLRLYHTPGHLACRRWSKWRKELAGANFLSNPPRETRRASCQSQNTALWKRQRGESFTLRKIDFKMSPHRVGAPYSSEVEHGQHCVSIWINSLPVLFSFACRDNNNESKVHIVNMIEFWYLNCKMIFYV